MCGRARANLPLPNVQVGVEVPKPRVKTMGEAGSLASTAKVWSVLVVSASGTTARHFSETNGDSRNVLGNRLFVSYTRGLGL